MNIMDPNEDLRGANDNLFRFVSGREVMAVRGSAKAALPFSSGSDENGGPSSEIFIVVLDEKTDGNSSAEATLSRRFSETRHENAFEKAAAHYVSLD